MNPDATGKVPTPKLLLIAIALMVVGLLPVAAAFWLFDGRIAQGIYVGLVLMTSVVTKLDLLLQWLAALAIGLVAAAGTFIGPRTGWLVLATIAVCLVQGLFTLHSAQSVAVLPAVLLLDALNGAPEQALSVGLASFCGAALLIVLALVAKIKVHSSPVTLPAVLVHTTLFTIGCVLLVLAGDWLDIERTNWALLAFCLMFTPALLLARSKSLAVYLSSVAAGSTFAVLIGLTGWVPLKLAALLIGALTTVAATLSSRTALGIGALTLTVVLLNSTASAASVGSVGLQRSGLALFSALVLFPLLWAGRKAMSRLEPAAGATNQPREV